MTAEMTETERRICAGLGLPTEQYLARKQEGGERRAKATRAERIDVLRQLAASGNVAEKTALETRIALIEQEQEQG